MPEDMRARIRLRAALRLRISRLRDPGGSNADVPYNQFVLEQIAGDLLPQPRLNPAERFNESVIGTGFWYLGEATHSPVDIRADEATRADNQIDVFGKTFLAQTLEFALPAATTTKFDAISTKDYYALSGYLQSSRFNVTCVDPPDERLGIIGQRLKNYGRKTKNWSTRSPRKRPRRRRRGSLICCEHRRPYCILEATSLRPRGSRRHRCGGQESGSWIPPRLAKWIAYLQGQARSRRSIPFHLWAAAS